MVFFELSLFPLVYQPKLGKEAFFGFCTLKSLLSLRRSPKLVIFSFSLLAFPEDDFRVLQLGQEWM